MIMTVLELDDVNGFLLEKQHLSPDARAGDIPTIVRDITALHSTRPSSAYLSLHARMKDFRKDELDREMFKKKTLGRIKCMRKTVHILNREFLPVAHAATRELLTKNAYQYCKKLGISDHDLKTISRSILGALEGREMAAGEIRKTVGGSKKTSSIINLLCDQGLIIRGPGKSWKDTGYRYSVFSEFFPDVHLDRMSQAEALASLVRNYLHSFGPVTETDISWWTGIGKIKIREALERMKDDTCDIRISGLKGEFIMLLEDRERMNKYSGEQVNEYSGERMNEYSGEQVNEYSGEREPVVNLLPCLDPHIMGYKDRERYLHRDRYHMVFDRSGNAASSILIDGMVEGVWDIEERPTPLVKFHMFQKWPVVTMKMIRREAKRTGAFVCDADGVRVKECGTMVSLRERTAGGFMTPLKGC